MVSSALVALFQTFIGILLHYKFFSCNSLWQFAHVELGES